MKIAVSTMAFDTLVQGRLASMELPIAVNAQWLMVIEEARGHILDLDMEEDVIEFAAKAGSDVGAVARAMYNMSMLFQKDVYAQFNGMIITIEHGAKP